MNFLHTLPLILGALRRCFHSDLHTARKQSQSPSPNDRFIHAAKISLSRDDRVLFDYRSRIVCTR